MTPVETLDASTLRRYEELGVHRLVLLPRPDAPRDRRHFPVLEQEILRTIERQQPSDSPAPKDHATHWNHRTRLLLHRGVDWQINPRTTQATPTTPAAYSRITRRRSGSPATRTRGSARPPTTTRCRRVQPAAWPGPSGLLLDEAKEPSKRIDGPPTRRSRDTDHGAHSGPTRSASCGHSDARTVAGGKSSQCSGHTYVTLEPERRPGRWNTLRARRVLRWSEDRRLAALLLRRGDDRATDREHERHRRPDPLDA
jgi:hypothetical protein